MQAMDIKTVFAIAGIAVGYASYIPYIREIWAGTTRPHLYTWLVWTLTFGIAGAGVIQGGSLLVGAGIVGGALIMTYITWLSLWNGTTDITMSDRIALAAALIACGLWIFFDNPVAAILFATGIDLVGYFPTMRKSWHAPEDESVTAWTGYVVSYTLAIAGLRTYNFFTLTYLLMTALASLVLLIEILVRKRILKK